MRLRPLLLVLLALVMSACATASDPAGQPAATTSSPTTAVSRAATAHNGPADPPPPGIIAMARRQPAPELRVTALDGSTVDLDELRGRPVVGELLRVLAPDLPDRATRLVKGG